MSEKANIALTSEKLSEAQKSYDESQPEQNSTAGLATLLMQGLS